MSRTFLLRLVLDGLAAVLLVFCFAYWWLGNGAHEAAGTAMFGLLAAHIVFNRRWWNAIPRTRAEPRSLLNVGLTIALLFAMVALLVTSVLISNTLAPVLPAWGGFTARQAHVAIAYWALVIVAVHLGFRWTMLMATARNLLRLDGPSRMRAWMLRTIALLVAVHGLWSVQALGLGDKLAMRMTLDWWNFEESVAGFFVHCGAVVGLIIVVTHASLELMRARSSRRLGRSLTTAPVSTAGEEG